MTRPAEAVESVRRVVRAINEAWRSGRFDQLNPCFHEGMVIVGPDFQPMARGREACVQSYRDFVSSAAVQDYQDTEPVVHCWGETAVASISWQITYEISGDLNRESGRDLFVLQRCDDRWLDVWRAVLFQPSS